MTEHRRTVTPRGFALPSWALVGSAVLVLAAAVWLGWLVVDGADDQPRVAEPTVTEAPTRIPSPSATPEPTRTTVTPSPTPSRTPSPSPTPTPTRTTPSVDRAATPVSVLNATRTPGLARSAAGRVTARGWPLAAVGNWRGYTPSNTVYYPPGREAEARQLASDLGVAAVAPSPSGMNQQRVTLVVVAPVT